MQPRSSITIISPGSTSRTYSASIKSKAQVSLATTHVSFKRPERKRTKAARVANRDEVRGREKQHRERAFGFAQNFRYRFEHIGRARTRDAVEDNFRVGGRRDNRAVLFKPFSFFRSRTADYRCGRQAICPCLQLTRNGCASRTETSPAVE
jgi:hypothetical protein